MTLVTYRSEIAPPKMLTPTSLVVARAERLAKDVSTLAELCNEALIRSKDGVLAQAPRRSGELTLGSDLKYEFERLLGRQPDLLRNECEFADPGRATELVMELLVEAGWHVDKVDAEGAEVLLIRDKD